MFVKRVGECVNEVVIALLNDVASQTRGELRETIPVENALNSVAEENPPGVINQEDALCSEYPRWWAQVNVGGASVQALLDNGSARTAMSPVVLSIASACEKKVQPYTKLASRDVVPILGQVELPFKIAGTRRNLTVIILQSLDGDCMLGAKFLRALNAHISPRTNRLVVGDPGEQVPIDIASIAVIDECDLSSVGLADVTPDQQKRLQDLLYRVLSESNAPLGCTKLIKHKIEVREVKPVKKRYYPVSKKIEE